jgi:hypothetical protein
MNLKTVTAVSHAVLLAAALTATEARAQSAAPAGEQVTAARATAMALGGKLKAELEAALKSDGPVKALAVCKTVAPAIASDLAASSGGKVGRTALKVRNPANAPDAFEKAVLLRFVEDVAKGADPTKLEHAEIVDADGKRLLRYMKAIPMAPAPCATCHGTDVAPHLLRAIRDLYPADQAVGFKPGEIRGAFTITTPLP